MKVLDIQDGFCTVEMSGVRKNCYAGYLDRPPVAGEFVLVHAGMAIRTIDEKEKDEILNNLALLLDGELNP